MCAEIFYCSWLIFLGKTAFLFDEKFRRDSSLFRRVWHLLIPIGLLLSTGSTFGQTPPTIPTSIIGLSFILLAQDHFPDIATEPSPLSMIEPFTDSEASLVITYKQPVDVDALTFEDAEVTATEYLPNGFRVTLTTQRVKLAEVLKELNDQEAVIKEFTIKQLFSKSDLLQHLLKKTYDTIQPDPAMINTVGMPVRFRGKTYTNDEFFALSEQAKAAMLHELGDFPVDFPDGSALHVFIFAESDRPTALITTCTCKENKECTAHYCLKIYFRPTGKPAEPDNLPRNNDPDNEGGAAGKSKESSSYSSTFPHLKDLFK